jgi:transcriptional regulator with XRE-family HTH domain
MGYPENLQRLCVQKGFDQALLAEHLGVSRSSISRILSGVREPKLGLAARLARLLGTSLDAMVDESAELAPGDRLVALSDDELAVLKLVRRLGTEEAIDRLLAVPANRRGEAG